MTTHTPKGSSSILQDGKLKSGIYKIQNVYTETYVDIETHSRSVCCRPAENLEEGNGLWEVKPLGAGYSVRRVEPGNPDQFCTVFDGVHNSYLSVTPYPVAWRVEIVDDPKHRGFEYIRFCWVTTDYCWAASNWSKANGTKVKSWTEGSRNSIPVLMWRLIPVQATEQDPPPSYGGNTTGQSPTCTQHADSENDDLGTIVTEVTTVTTTTRKRYRVEDS